MEPALTCSRFLPAHEKKCISRGEAVAPVSQSKLSRVSSGFGLSKLTGSRRNRKETGLNKNNLSAQVPQVPMRFLGGVRLCVCTSVFTGKCVFTHVCA